MFRNIVCQREEERSGRGIFEELSNYPNKQQWLRITPLQHFSNFIVHTTLLGALLKLQPQNKYSLREA